MRLKSLNLNNRSQNQAYNSKQKSVVKSVSESVNELGVVFDQFMELENFVTANILEETANLIKAREKREEIEEEEGLEIYLEEYFKPAANALNDKLQETLDQWNITHEDCTVEKMRLVVENLKSVGESLKELENVGLLSTTKTLQSLQSLIDEFGKFRVAKSVLTDNIANRINLTLEARDKIIKYKGQIQNSDSNDIDDDISIDDL